MCQWLFIEIGEINWGNINMWKGSQSVTLGTILSGIPVRSVMTSGCVGTKYIIANHCASSSIACHSSCSIKQVTLFKDSISAVAYLTI